MGALPQNNLALYEYTTNSRYAQMRYEVHVTLRIVLVCPVMSCIITT